MCRLRAEGLSIHAIAAQLHRSSRTVHTVLSERGTREPPPRGKAPAALDGGGREAQSPRLRSWRSRRKRVAQGKGDTRSPTMKTLKDKILDAAAQHIKDDPDLGRQVLAAHFGIKLPTPSKPSLDDILLKEITESPQLRREWAERYLERIQKRHRSELDILGEGLALVLSCAEYLNKGRWPDAVKELFKSGEVTKIVDTIARALTASREATPSQEALVQVPPSARAEPIAPRRSELPAGFWQEILSGMPSADELMRLAPKAKEGDSGSDGNLRVGPVAQSPTAPGMHGEQGGDHETTTEPTKKVL